ncbi:MaoC family dehydratase [Natronomonas gomsonensis]|uniref:MaoC family dehydratase n=1 Tax=Natronomonas gomsonensis TaxID=1046043 RepID=UPI0020CA58F1|nr:MaoC family dehydratase [Natronomonas gomsonensis]MCY4729925.1 MaoC family dehydratase [Natronomonas gomsonensis]
MNNDRTDLRYFEDIEVGTVHELGTYMVNKKDIIEFAEQWDPQYFHVDAEAAADSMFGELVASGIHTLAILQRIASLNYYAETDVHGGPGIEDIQFTTPVRPGDTLSVIMTVESKRDLESSPNRGLVHFGFTVTNQNDVTVLTATVLSLIGKR